MIAANHETLFVKYSLSINTKSTIHPPSTHFDTLSCVVVSLTWPDPSMQCAYGLEIHMLWINNMHT